MKINSKKVLFFNNIICEVNYIINRIFIEIDLEISNLIKYNDLFRL